MNTPLLKNKAGMYEVNNPMGWPQVRVGKFIICRQDEGSVWIRTDDEEGGQFSDELFEAALVKFWEENF